MAVAAGNNHQDFQELEELLREKEETIAQLYAELQNQHNEGDGKLGGDHGKKDEALPPPGKLMGGDDVMGSYNILYGKYKALLTEKQNLEETLR